MKAVHVLSLTLCATLVSGAAWAAKDFKTDLEKNSYAIGINLAKQLKKGETPFDPDFVFKGLRDEKKGKSLLAPVEADAALQKVREEAQKKAKEKFDLLASENKKRGALFLAEYAKREGVKTVPGGVLYRELQAGTGDKPSGGDMIRCNYRGTLVDGKEFDATPPGKPAMLKMSKLILGWKDALMQMPVGSKWEIVIPAEKAYGERGSKAVGPNETLIFEVELLEVP
jgi:FKBP-type peptidyl-prolyl cis-trans isomerase FklB